MAHDCSHPTMAAGVYPFDARGVAKRFRHAAIFGALDALHRARPCAFVTTMILCRYWRKSTVTTGGLSRLPTFRVNRVKSSLIFRIVA